MTGSPRTAGLLGQIAAGDAPALRHCIAEYAPLVWSIARRFAASPHEAEAAVQEVFLELWKHAGRVDPSMASEPACITMIARRRMIERLRRTEPRPQLRSVLDGIADAEQGEIQRCPEASIAAGVLATLDPHQRRVMALAIGQGRTHAEVADAAEIPVGTVKSLVRRALVAVRKRLADPGPTTNGDLQKRVHTLLTDAAVAGLSEAEHDELAILVEHRPLDPSYELAAAAIELGLHPHAESPPAGLEDRLLEQARRFWGFNDQRDEHAMLEDSLTNGRIGIDRRDSEDPDPDDSLRGDVLAAEPITAVSEQARKRRYHAEVDAQLDRLQQPESRAPKPKPATKPAPEPAPDDDREDDDHEDDDHEDDEPKPKRDRRPKPAAPVVLANDYRIARWATGISAVASLIMLAIGLWLYTHRDEPDLGQIRSDVEASEDRIEWQFVAKPDDAVADGASGEMVWSTDLQLGVVTVRGLAPNDPGSSQYQLWIVDRGRDGPPVNGGVFNVDDAGELEIPVTTKLLIADPAAFVITVERPGGVVVSDQQRVAFVAAPSP